MAALPPGIYTVEATMAGFHTEIQKGLNLEVNQTLRVDLALKGGEVSERVEVNASTVQLQTDSSTVATTVENKKVVELPLNSASALPSSQYSYRPQLERAWPRSNLPEPLCPSVDFAARTITIRSTALITTRHFLSRMVFSPPSTPIQEFKVQTNITAAEFGTGAGANVNLATKVRNQ